MGIILFIIIYLIVIILNHYTIRWVFNKLDLGWDCADIILSLILSLFTPILSVVALLIVLILEMFEDIEPPKWL